MARRAREATPDDGTDELERAEASIAERQKKDKGKGREKPSSSSRREGRSNNNASESEPEEESDNGAAAGSSAGGKSQLSCSDITERARDLVRLAICNEVSRRPLRRDEINKKILQGSSKSFQKVYDEANQMLESVWGMELVPLFPNEVEDIVPEADNNKKKSGKKRKSKNGEASASDEDEAEEEGTAAKKSKRRGLAKMFCVRTLLETSIIKKAVKSNDDLDPAVQERYNEDLRGALGDAVAGERGDEELKEWKKGDDAIFDWKTGPEQRTLMGILYVILSLIMVNERVLTDEQLQNHLKRLELRYETRLPLNPAAMRPEKQTLGTFLQALIRQQYLERTKLTSGAASKNKPSGNTQGGTQLKRVRATQATQQQNAEEGLSGDPDSEWRWGPRAFKEFGEDGVASFIKDFYRSHYRGQQTRGNEENQKEGKVLLTEIAKGATGNKPDTGLIPARE